MSTTINQSNVTAYNNISNANQFKVNNGGKCVLPNRRAGGTTLSNMLSTDGAICWNSGRGLVQFLGNSTVFEIRLYPTP
jgi:hypothetical protein